MKKLFTETKSEAGLWKSVMNPRALFDSVCYKAPQFRGFQQQDSHEFLRCLLDGLCIEESSLRKELCVSDTDGETSSHDQKKPTLVDSVFGGEISSTVSCLECGHSSIVYEPFLDLSLPVPSKKRNTPPKNDGSAKPETVPDKQCARAMQSSKDAAASGHHEETVDYDDFSGFFDDPCVSDDDETVAQGKGEAPSSFVSGHYEEIVDYDDFSCFFDELGVSRDDKRVAKGKAPSSFVRGDHDETIDYVDFRSFFDEPQISEGPAFGPPSKAEVSETCFMAVSSDSDPEVLDDSDSPVSVDRCLALFTKPEILSGDNAWHCENCSKNLRLQRLTEKRETKQGLGNGRVTENGASLASDDECRDNPLSQSCIDLENGHKEITISSQPANGNESDEKREDEAVDSEKVMVKRAATKRVLVNKAPSVLTVHLKRFSQDARGRLSKLSGHVDFKEFIDLGQYMNSRCTEEDQPVYRLAGLVEHSGTLGRGHYVAYIRGGHKERRNSDVKEPNSSIWYHASDSFVRQASFEEVLRSEAYLLFYQRI